MMLNGQVVLSPEDRLDQNIKRMQDKLARIARDGGVPTPGQQRELRALDDLLNADCDALEAEKADADD